MSKIKKILAVVLAMAMVMAMGITAMAGKTGASITVTGLSTEGNQIVNAYLIYELDDNDNLWVLSNWAESYVTKPDDLESATVLENLKKNVPERPDATETSSEGSVKLDNLQAGAYLVLVTDTENHTTYGTMVAVTYEYGSDGLIEVADVTVVAKANGYSVGKSQSETTNDNDGVVAVGDIITYTITTTVPFVKANETASFVITDTIDGADYYLTGDGSTATVTIGGNEISGATFVVNEETKKSFTIDLSNYATSDNTYAGKTVMVTYTAKVTAVDSVTNTAKSSHSDGDVNSTTTAYTGQLTITKYAETEGTETPQKLQGAKFVLYKKVSNVEYYAGIDENGYFTGDWIEKTGDKVPDGAGTVETGEDGTATVKGLDVGTYYFKETIAPDGYSVNGTDVSGEITLKVDENGSKTVSGSAEMTDTKLAQLPSTGGIGTTIFTIVGCLIMIGAAAIFFISRRKAEK